MPYPEPTLYAIPLFLLTLALEPLVLARIGRRGRAVRGYERRDALASIGMGIGSLVFVGIINLFPMLPLDGGHVVIAVYERIRSRRGRMYHADVNKLAPVVWAFVLLLGFVVVTSLFLDITHPVKNPFQ